MKDVVVFGTGGHAKVVFDILQKQGLYRVIAFYSLNENLAEFRGVKHFSQTEFANSPYKAGLVAIGDNFKRHQLVQYIKNIKSDFEFVSAVHPKATIADGVKIGQGSVVMAHVAVNSDSHIAEHCILNTSSSVDHDCIIDDFASVAPGAILGGNVKLGFASAVSLGSKIKHGCKIGENTVLGAGSLLLEDLNSGVVAYGSPAKVVRQRKFGDTYL